MLGKTGRYGNAPIDKSVLNDLWVYCNRNPDFKNVSYFVVQIRKSTHMFFPYLKCLIFVNFYLFLKRFDLENILIYYHYFLNSQSESLERFTYQNTYWKKWLKIHKEIFLRNSWNLGFEWLRTKKKRLKTASFHFTFQSVQSKKFFISFTLFFTH